VSVKKEENTPMIELRAGDWLALAELWLPGLYADDPGLRARATRAISDCVRMHTAWEGRAPGECLVPGCGRPYATQGWCRPHLMRVQRDGHPDAATPIRRYTSTNRSEPASDQPTRSGRYTHDTQRKAS
jgi:hypothetical protein